jgi:hypothetical protein
MRQTAPVFGTAAAIAFLMCALLAACGGSSEGSPPSDSPLVDDGVATAQSAARNAATSLRLFVPDLGHAALTALATLEPVPGAALAGVTIEASKSSGNNVQIDAARDELYVIGGRFVTVYAHASALTSAATPVRSFPLPATLRTPRTLYLDVANDVLYAGGDTADGGGEIVAWAYAHTVRGMPATPSRALFIEGGVSFFTIDTLRERLYVVNSKAGVQVFANADSVSGLLRPSTTIPVLGMGLAVDAARDRLYVADMFAGLILVDAASGASPVVTRTLSIDDARFVSLDVAHDRAYVSALGSLYVIDNASELTAATTLGAPAHARSFAASFGAVAIR